MKRVFGVAILLSLILNLWADSFRSAIAEVVSVSAERPEGEKLNLGYSGSAGIALENDGRFLLGIELELRIPKEVANAPNSLAVSIYRDLKPEPDPKRLAYDGTLIYSTGIQARVNMVLQIPLRKDSGLKSSTFATVLPAIVAPQGFPIIVKIQQITKELPAGVEKAQFSLKIKPIVANEGLLQLSLKFPEGYSGKSPISVFIDDAKVASPLEPMVLKSGSHVLRVVSEDFRDETRSFVIDQGKRLDLSIQLQDTTPLLIIEAPENAIVTIDGQKLDNPQKTPLQTTPGDHIIVFKIGDYSITKKITVEKGKTYRISLIVDVSVTEE